MWSSELHVVLPLAYAMAAMSLASETTSSSSVLPQTDSDVGMLENESSTGSTVSGPGMAQVSPKVSLLDRLRNAKVRPN